MSIFTFFKKNVKVFRSIERVFFYLFNQTVVSFKILNHKSLMLLHYHPYILLVYPSVWETCLQTLIGEKDRMIAELDAASTGEAVRLGAAIEVAKAEISQLKNDLVRHFFYVSSLKNQWAVTCCQCKCAKFMCY